MRILPAGGEALEGAKQQQPPQQQQGHSRGPADCRDTACPALQKGLACAVQVRELSLDGATKVKWKTSELSFQQAKTWLGRPATEKVEGWNTQVRPALPGQDLLPSCSFVPYLFSGLPVFSKCGHVVLSIYCFIFCEQK